MSLPILKRIIINIIIIIIIFILLLCDDDDELMISIISLFYHLCAKRFAKDSPMPVQQQRLPGSNARRARGRAGACRRLNDSASR